MITNKDKILVGTKVIFPWEREEFAQGRVAFFDDDDRDYVYVVPENENIVAKININSIRRAIEKPIVRPPVTDVISWALSVINYECITEEDAFRFRQYARHQGAYMAEGGMEGSEFAACLKFIREHQATKIQLFAGKCLKTAFDNSYHKDHGYRTGYVVYLRPNTKEIMKFYGYYFHAKTLGE